MHADRFIALMQYCLPKHALSRLAGFLANHQNPRLKNRLIAYFMNQYKPDLSEAIEQDPYAYATYNDFFTRQLRPECRPIDNDPNTLVSPVDGSVSECGLISSGKLLQAKGHAYSLYHLLGDYYDHAEKFTRGSFATLYLAPTDYHRVHMPFTGTLTEMLYIPGQLFSVQPATVKYISGLFARNERVICFFDTEIGPMAVILVGAVIVGSMSTVWHGQVAPNQDDEIHRWCYPNPKTPTTTLMKGDELGAFSLGSTVIVLHADESLQWLDTLTPGASVRYGQAMTTQCKDS